MPKKKRKDQPRYADYMKSPAWFKKRYYAFYLLGKVCEICGTRKGINVHHNNYGALGSERPRADLVIMCAGCHLAFHKLIPAQKLGKKSTGYTTVKCTLCMGTQLKKINYRSCSMSLQRGHSARNPKEKIHRVLKICTQCVEALDERLLSENKISKSAVQKEKRETAAKKKEVKRKKRLLRLEAKKEKAKLLPPTAPTPKKVKKPKRGGAPYSSPEVSVRPRSLKKTT